MITVSRLLCGELKAKIESLADTSEVYVSHAHPAFTRQGNAYTVVCNGEIKGEGKPYAASDTIWETS